MEFYGSLAIFATLLLVCLLSSKISSVINMPCLLLFLGVGLLFGSEGLGRIAFDDATTANYIGSVAMAFILFSGGFDTSWKSIKPVFLPGALLSSVGVLLTSLFCGFFLWSMRRLCFPEYPIPFSGCLLLGAIISSTDAAAVFSILRSRSVSLKGELQPLLEFESGSNDPMATFLTIFMLGAFKAETASGGVMPLAAYWIIVPSFIVKMSLGIGIGFLIGRAAGWLFNKVDFEFNGLYYVLGVTVVIAAFSLAEIAQGNGFMAVYVAGMTMGNRRFIYCNGIGRFCDGVAWMMQVVLFCMLGLLAYPSQLWEAKWVGLTAALFLMLVARPLAVMICLLFSKFSIRERLLVSWVGLRGGAPIMLATFPLMAQLEHANLMFHMVFFIVLTSVLFQGMSIMPVAKLLKLDAPLRKSERNPLAVEETGNDNAASRELTVTETHAGIRLSELHLPDGVLVLMIRRDGKILVPRGDTTLACDDMLTVMGSTDAVQATVELLA